MYIYNRFIKILIKEKKILKYAIHFHFFEYASVFKKKKYYVSSVGNRNVSIIHGIS